MQNINIDSAGSKLYINFGRDISTGTDLKLTLQPESGEIKEVTPTVGTSNIDIDNKNMLANQYIQYTTLGGDFEQYYGRWRMKGSATVSGETFVTDYILFRVMP